MPAPIGQIEIRDRSEGSCVSENGFFCFDWFTDNIGEFVTPTVEHLILVSVAVAAGFLIAFGLALFSHNRGWLIPPLSAVTVVLYTIPSIAAFFLLLPVTGRGTDTALIALTAYTLQIIYRNTVTGLDNVPKSAVESGRGMGLTERQLLWQVKLPLAMPEIIAGVRVATVTTVGLATLAVFAGAGGLGNEILDDITFRTRVLTAALISVAMAAAFDLLLLGLQRLASPWRRAAQQ